MKIELDDPSNKVELVRDDLAIGIQKLSDNDLSNILQNLETIGYFEDRDYSSFNLGKHSIEYSKIKEIVRKKDIEQLKSFMFNYDKVSNGRYFYFEGIFVSPWIDNNIEFDCIKSNKLDKFVKKHGQKEYKELPKEYKTTLLSDGARLNKILLWDFLWKIKNPSEDEIAYFATLILKVIEELFYKSIKNNDNFIVDEEKNIIENINCWSGKNHEELAILQAERWDFLKNMQNDFLHGGYIFPMESKTKVDILNDTLDLLTTVICDLTANLNCTFEYDNLLFSLMVFPKFTTYENKVSYNSEDVSRLDILSNGFNNDIVNENKANITYSKCFHGFTLLENYFYYKIDSLRKKDEKRPIFIDVFKLWLTGREYNLDPKSQTEESKMWEKLNKVKEIRDKRFSHVTNNAIDDNTLTIVERSLPSIEYFGDIINKANS